MPVSEKPRRPKVFGDGPSDPMDRNLKTRISVFARAWNARQRTGRQHIGPLTRVTLDVLRALLWGFHNARTGRCFPGYQSIATKAGCGRSAVHLAINALEAAGIISWVNRLAIIRDRCIDATGATVWHPRVIRTSNAYHFRDPQQAPPLPPRQESPKSENRTGTLYQDNFDSSLTAQRRPLDPSVPGEAALIAFSQRLAAGLG
jgi:hypothetical protein